MMFSYFNNVISFFNKIRDGNNMMLENRKQTQNKFIPDLNETEKQESRNQESKYVHCTILKQVTKHNIVLSQEGKSRYNIQKRTK